MIELNKYLPAGVLFLLTLGSGVWLSSVGKPLNTLIFNVHKLIALGAVVFFAIQISKAMKVAEIQVFSILLVALAAISALALFATGAMMSIGKVNYTLMLWVHRITPLTMAVSLGVFLFKLMARAS